MSDARREARGARFDRAIDGAVREMLDVEPRADLRTRVMEQLPASSSRLPAFGFRLPAFGFRFGVLAGAAAAVVILAVFLSWRAGAPVPPSSIVRGTDQRLPAPVSAQPTAPARASAPARQETTVARVADTRPRPPVAPEPGLVIATNVDESATTGIEPLQAIAPMPSIAPIEVAPVAQRSIAPADMAMRPLNPIAEMQIAPLTPPARRN